MKNNIRLIGKEIKDNRFFYFLFFFFIILHIALISSLRIYPFIDLPNHLAEATIFKYYNNPYNRFSVFYSVNIFPMPNIFHTVFCSLFPSIEAGNKMFYILYTLLFPGFILCIIKKLKGNIWFAMLSFLLLYNYNVSCGFSGFTIAIPFFILLLYFLLDENIHGIYKKIIIAGLLIILFFMHAITSMFSLLFFFLYCFFNKNFLKNFYLSFPVMIIIFFWYKYSVSSGESIFSFLVNYYKNQYFQTITKRLGLLMFDNYFLYNGISGCCIALFFSLFIIVPFLILFNSRREKVNKNITLFIFCSLCCYLFLPDMVPGNWCLYERFSVFFLVSIVLFNSMAFPVKIKKINILLICFACLFHFILWGDYFLSFQRENHFFRENIFPDDNSKIITGLISEKDYRGKPLYLHFPNYYIVWKHGIACTMITDYRFAIIERKITCNFLPSYMNMTLYNDNSDLNRVDAIIVKGKRTGKFDMRDFKLTKISGKWLLYEKVKSKNVE